MLFIKAELESGNRNSSSFTFRSVALMKAASLLARKVTAAATSLMSPILLAMWNFPQTGSHFSLPPAPAA